MTSLFPPFNRRSSFRKQPYFYEAGRGVNYKSTGGPFPTLDLNFLSGSLDPRITFSRASNATLTDSTGKITYAPNNLLTYSEQVDNAAWLKSNLTVTADATTAPNGTTTADLCTPTAAGYLIRTSTTVSTANYIVSCYVKPSGTVNLLNFGAYAGPNAATVNFDVLTGTFSSPVSLGTGVLVSYTATNVGNGWYRIFAVFSGINNAVLQFNPVYNAAQSGGIYVWGAQLEAVTYQTTPSTYNATTTAAYYGPRFDYDPVTLAAKGLLIEEARTNLFTYSEQFDNAAWNKAFLTVTPNTTTAPDGTSTADTVTDNSTSGTSLDQTVTVSSGATVTHSRYFKYSNCRWVRMVIGDATNFVRGWFDIQNGVLGSTAVGGVGTNASNSITNVGNGWYRCTLTGALTGLTSYNLPSMTADANGSTTRVNNGAYFTWGAQSETGAFATSYIPTVAASVARSADIATMTGTNFSSWFNQGLVNLALQSQTFDNASWTKTATTASADTTTAPDGTTTADTITPNTTNTFHVVQQSASVAASAVYTLSVYAKPNGYNFIVLYATGGSGPNVGAYFNVSTGVVGGSFTAPPTSSSITSVGNGWYRCTITFTNANQTTLTPRIYVASADGTASFAGDGTSGVYLWGAQLEVGSTATTYIPTTTVPVASPPAVGTFVSKFDENGVDTTARRYVWMVSETGNTRLALRATDVAVNYPIAAVGTGSTVVSLNGTALTSMVPAIIAVAFGSDMALAQNGAVTATSSSAAAVIGSSLSIGSNSGLSGFANGHLQYIKYYNQRLPNAKLQALTV